MKRSPNRKQNPKGTDEFKLLQAILRQVPRHGWTMAALEAGAKQAGLGKGHLYLIWPHGVRDAVAAFSNWADALMLDGIAQDRTFVHRRTRDKVAFAVWHRLQILEPHSEALKQLHAWALLPTNAPYALKHLYKTCDAIWRAAGDRSADFNFYTKRGLLAYVLKTTTIFWITDKSKGRQASQNFLDRRIQEVLQLGKVMGQVKSLPGLLDKLDIFAGLGRFFRKPA